MDKELSRVMAAVALLYFFLGAGLVTVIWIMSVIIS